MSTVTRKVTFHNKDDKFHRSLQQKGVQVLFQDRVLYILEDDSDVVCIDCHCEVVIQVLGSVPPDNFTFLRVYRKTEDLGQSKDKRMPLQPKPKETNIIIINNNMMIQHVIEPG